MGKRSLDRLGALQQAVLEIVWDLGEATVAQVRDRLQGKKSPAYTTILTVMQKLDKAGWLTHREEGRTYVYRAVRTREEEGTSTLKQFIRRVFSGDPLRMFQHLLASDDLSAAELAALKKMIDQRRKEQKS